MTPAAAPFIPFSDGQINAAVMVDMVHPRNSDNETIQKFYQLVRNFNNSERSKLLKFITGSSRLNQTTRIRIDVKSYQGDESFPIGHTCGYSCDVPQYSSQKVMEDRFRVAIEMCGEIDDDGNYVSDYGSSSSGRASESYESEVASVPASVSQNDEEVENKEANVDDFEIHLEPVRRCLSELSLSH